MADYVYAFDPCSAMSREAELRAMHYLIGHSYEDRKTFRMQHGHLPDFRQIHGEDYQQQETKQNYLENLKLPRTGIPRPVKE